MSVHEGQPHSFVGCLAKLLPPCDGSGTQPMAVKNEEVSLRSYFPSLS